MTSLHTRSNKGKRAGHTDRSVSRSHADSPRAWLRSAALGCVCTVGIGLLLLLLAAVAAKAADDPHAWVPPLSLTALYLTALLAGIVTVRIHGHASLLCGALAAGLMLFLLCLLRVRMPADAPAPLGHALLRWSPIPPLTIAGAYLARKREKTAMRHKHR